MKFLFFSDTGDSCGLALRMIQEGNEVSTFIRCEHQSICDGIVPKITDWKFDLTADTVCIFDATGMGVIADGFKSAGYAVVGGSSLMDRLEMDREYSKELMEHCKIKVPDSKTFKDYESARGFIEKNPESRFVFKPGAEMSGATPSYVSSDNDDLLRMLEFYERKSGKSCEFSLEEFTKGIEISTEVWCSNGKVLTPFNHTLETKKAFDGDIGPSGGCAGNTIWTTEESNITSETVQRLEEFLLESEYCGPLDVNGIIAEDGHIYGLEFTPRFGYDATPTLLCELLDMDISQFFSDLARGQISDRVSFKDGFASGVRLTIPPWPSEEHEAAKGIPVRGLRGKDKQRFYPMNVEEIDGDLVSCGAYGIIGLLTGFGKTIEASFEEPYKIVDKLKVPNLQYRTDLVKLFEKRFRAVEREVEFA